MEAEERPKKIQKLESPGLDTNGSDIQDASAPVGSSEPHDVPVPADDESEGIKVAEFELGQVAHDDESSTAASPPLSKNRRKKLARQEQWEAGRAWRKARKKEKLTEKRAQKRLAKLQGTSSTGSAEDTTVGATADTQHHSPTSPPKPRHHTRPTQLPITILLDCAFDDLMLDKERTSLASQLTRCYSDNKNSILRAHLVVCGFGGLLKERFETVLGGHHRSWRDVDFTGEDFVEAAKEAQERMANWDVSRPIAGPLGGSERGKGAAEVVYLTSDSPDTLTHLSPYSTYIVGGLVDRNRHKGICYKRATDRGVRTAKLPIGDYMQMASRFVLATNHVVEIMLRWIELGDWAEAFLRVLPKRKGGVLKTRIENGQSKVEDGDGHDKDETEGQDDGEEAETGENNDKLANEVDGEDGREDDEYQQNQI